MSEPLQHIEKAVNGIVKHHFLSVLRSEVKQFSDFLNDFKKMLDNYSKLLKNLPEANREIVWTTKTLGLKQELFAYLAFLKGTFAEKDFDQKYSGFLQEMDRYIARQPSEITERQNDACFQLSLKDKFPARGLKILKILFFRLSAVPNAFANIFRKDKRKKPYWRHRIPMRKLLEVHLRDEMVLCLQGIYRDFYEIINFSLAELEKFSSNAEDFRQVFQKDADPPSQIIQLDIGEYQKAIVETKSRIEEYRSTLQETTDAVLKQQFANFKEKYDKAGTVELLTFWYRGFFLQRQKDAVRSAFRTKEVPYLRSMEILYDTWLFHLELKILNYIALVNYLNAEKTYCLRISDNIIKELNNVKDFIVEINDKVASIEVEDQRKLRAALVNERQKVYKRLSESIIPKTMDFIASQDLPNLVNQVESSVVRQIGKTSKTRTISQSSKPVLPISKMITDTLSPQELIKFEAYPKFQEAAGVVRNEIFQELNKIQEYVKELTQIVDFALDSAIVASDDDDTNTNPQTVAAEGLKRALTKVEETHTELGMLFQPVSEQLRTATGEFCDQVISLQDQTVYAKLRNRILASRAMAPTIQLKAKIQKLLVTGLPGLWLLLVNKWKELKAWYAELRLHLGFDTSPELKSTEITDYFAESKTAVSKLPYVYQRLFALGPAFDENLVMERAAEIELFERAWQNWQRGTFSPVAIIGERGAGISTLINSCLKKNCYQLDVSKVEIKEMIFEIDPFLKFLGEQIGQPESSSFEDLVDYLNAGDRRVILLDSVELLFIKKVNGFEVLRLLFELISKTNGKVFWITTCTLYAWEFLQKTITISDYHAYIIRLGNLKNDEMEEAILRRHRISGYRIEYVPTKKYVTKRFKRLEIADQQALLEREYFYRLNQFAQSNLSLAIVYWLRSAKKVTGNTIFIGLQDVDFSFINLLTNDKIFNLHKVILHGCLSAEQLATIRNLSVEHASLELRSLQDDGFLFSDEQRYELNFLLYRPVVRLLKTKNLIH